MLFLYPSAYVLDLGQSKLARKNYHVRKLRVELGRLKVGNVHLRGSMHLNAHGPSHLNDSHIGSYNGRNPSIPSSLQRLANILHLRLVHHNVQRQVSLHPVLPANAHDLRKILICKVIGGMAPHVQIAHPKIHGISPALDGRHQALEIPRRCHYLNPLVHINRFKNKLEQVVDF